MNTALFAAANTLNTINMLNLFNMQQRRQREEDQRRRSETKIRDEEKTWRRISTLKKAKWEEINE